MKSAGYIINSRDGEQGERGFIYDYIFAEDGVYLRAENQFIGACIRIAEVQIRGLRPRIGWSFNLKTGRIPRRIWEHVMETMMLVPDREVYMAIVWDGEYKTVMPEQQGSMAGVTYTPVKNAVVDIHSHGTMGAMFSGTDNNDEQGMRLYVVLGKLHAETEYVLRLGIYGYFQELEWWQVFSELHR